MPTSPRWTWLRAAILAGLAYLIIGRVFALPSGNARLWRAAAWLASGAVFGAHFSYEHFRLRSLPRMTALHTAAGVAIGGFGLALVGMIRSVATTHTLGPLWLVALVAWPAVTAIPAFIVALLAASVLTRAAARRQ